MDQLLQDLKMYLDPKKVWTPEEEGQLTLLLRFSGNKILNQRYPYDDTTVDVPARYQSLQVRIAAELYAKLGAEGQITHSENGISRAWDSADVAQGLLNEITPYVGVIS